MRLDTVDFGGTYKKNSMIKKELVLHEMYDVKKSTATSETDPLFKLGWDQVKKI